VGNISQALENEVSLLKTSVLLNEIAEWNQKVTPTSILQALDRLQKKLDKQLMTSVRYARLKVCDNNDDESSTQGKKIFNSDPVLSLRAKGQEVTALLFQDDELENLNEDGMREVVDLICGFVNFEKLRATTSATGQLGDKTRKRLNSMEQRGRNMRRKVGPPSDPQRAFAESMGSLAAPPPPADLMEYSLQFTLPWEPMATVGADGSTQYSAIENVVWKLNWGTGIDSLPEYLDAARAKLDAWGEVTVSLSQPQHDALAVDDLYQKLVTEIYPNALNTVLAAKLAREAKDDKIWRQVRREHENTMKRWGYLAKPSEEEDPYDAFDAAHGDAWHEDWGQQWQDEEQQSFQDEEWQDEAGAGIRG
jgi:hypothetical protein